MLLLNRAKFSKLLTFEMIYVYDSGLVSLTLLSINAYQYITLHFLLNQLRMWQAWLVSWCLLFEGLTRCITWKLNNWRFRTLLVFFEYSVRHASDIFCIFFFSKTLLGLFGTKMKVLEGRAGNYDG